MNLINQVFNVNCLDYMRNIEDQFFDLALIDPPYGIHQGGEKNYTRGNLVKAKIYKPYNDNHAPSPEFFSELKRISKNQIIFGANHFLSKLSSPIDSSCWLVWDKVNGNTDFADCELAWTSFSTAVRLFRFRWSGMLQGNMKSKEVRIHPNQKPVLLYGWILKNYSKENDKIFDSHVGSGSSRIAAYKLKRHFWGCEIDNHYFRLQEERFRHECLEELPLF